MARGTTDRFSGQFTDARSFQRPEPVAPRWMTGIAPTRCMMTLTCFFLGQETDNLKSSGCNHDNQYI